VAVSNCLNGTRGQTWKNHVRTFTESFVIGKLKYDFVKTETYIALTHKTKRVSELHRSEVKNHRCMRRRMSDKSHSGH